jgi:hypothetical protein
LLPARAFGQACCAGASALGIARLAPHEDAVAGLGARLVWLYGSMDGERRYVPAPPKTAELDLQQDFVGTVRVLGHGQLTAIVPIVETYRKVPGLAEVGGGLGDVQLAARYDFIEPGASPQWPGMALSFGLTLPTGRAPETSSPLATASTGTGSTQAGAQIALERGFGDVLVNLSGSALWQAPRVVFDLHEQRGPAFTAFAAGGYSFRNGVVAALTAAYTAELDGRLEGVTVPGSGHELTRVGVSGGYALSSDWRLQASLFGDLPVGPLARNQPLGAGLSAMLLRSAW